MSQARNVVKYGPMTYIERVKGKGKKKENYYLYLFNDLMVIAKRKRYATINFDLRCIVILAARKRHLEIFSVKLVL